MNHSETLLRCLKKSCISVALPIYTLVQACYLPFAYSFPAASLSPVEPASESLKGRISDEFLFVEPQSGLFATLNRAEPNAFPTTVGRLTASKDSAQRLPAWRLIQSDNYYIFKRPEEPNFLQITERLPSGGFGRILRYRGWVANNRRWLDLEFIFQDRERSILILDYQANRFFRTTFKDEGKPSSQLFPFRDNVFFGELNTFYVPSLKIVILHTVTRRVALPMSFRIHSQFEPLSGLRDWFKDKVRGPPAGGLYL